MEVKSIIESLEQKARRAVPANTDYIGDDGLIYCGICHTPKQTRIKIFNIEKTPFCLCKCGAEKRKAVEERDRKEMIEENRKKCFGSSIEAECTFSNASDNDVIKKARDYYEHFTEFYSKRKGLLLFGSVGSGKTYAVACIANALIDDGYTVHMVKFPTIRNNALSIWNGRAEYFNELNNCDLLIIDDLAAESKTEYMKEIVYYVIDNRDRSGKPIIITSNLTANEIKNPADIEYQRIFSRLFKMCIPFECAGTDNRREILKKDFAEMKHLFTS